MSIDRASALRHAVTLVRQGKLDATIAQCLRVVEDEPRDWSAANVLGDLYGRAGSVDQAVETFGRVAAHLREEGAVAKAAAVCKKILELRPGDEQALLQMSDLLASQGLYADARSYLNTAMEGCRQRGDTRGAAEARIRLDSLDASRLRDVVASVAVEQATVETPVDAPTMPATVSVDVDAPDPELASSLPSTRVRDHFELSTNAVDLGAILGELDSTPPSANRAAAPGAMVHDLSECVEIDLTMALRAIGPPSAPTVVADPGDLDGVFEPLRQEVAQTTSLDAASLLYDAAATLEQDGKRAEALAIFLEIQAQSGAYRDVAARIDRLNPGPGVRVAP